MSCSREQFDLFNKYGRSAIWRSLKRGSWPSYMLRDSFGRLACLILGHKRYVCSVNIHPPEYACSRCCRFIK